MSWRWITTNMEKWCQIFKDFFLSFHFSLWTEWVGRRTHTPNIRMEFNFVYLKWNVFHFDLNAMCVCVCTARLDKQIKQFLFNPDWMCKNVENSIFFFYSIHINLYLRMYYSIVYYFNIFFLCVWKNWK